MEEREQVGRSQEGTMREGGQQGWRFGCGWLWRSSGWGSSSNLLKNRFSLLARSVSPPDVWLPFSREEEGLLVHLTTGSSMSPCSRRSREGICLFHDWLTLISLH